jgi:hypothetical protein
MSKDVDNIICGDLNIHALKPENTDVEMTFAEVGLGPLIDQATRKTFKSATLLDQIYCSNRKLSGFIGDTDIADHFIVGLFHDKISNIGKKLKPELHQCMTPNHFTICASIFAV